MTSSNALPGAAVPATTTLRADTGAAGGAETAATSTEEGAGFTTLLAAALGTSSPRAVAEALQGLQRAVDDQASGTDAPVDPEASGAEDGELSAEALQAAIAALVADVGSPHVSGASAATGPPGTAGATVPATAQLEGQPARAVLAAVLSGVPTTAAGGQGAAPGAMPAETAQTAQTAQAAQAAQAAPTGAPGVPAAAVEMAMRASGSRSNTATPLLLPVPVEAGTATDAVSAPATTTLAGGSGTGGTGVTLPAPAVAPAPTPPGTGLQASVVARVMAAVEVLENAPPPRNMMVEVPDSDGLRLQVAMRGSEVHVSLLAGRSTPDLGAWGRELAAGLASRGMSLGGFTSDDGSPGRQEQQSDRDDPRPYEDRGHQPRRSQRDGRTRDGGLRL